MLVNFGNNYWDINGTNVYLDPGYTNVLIGNGVLAIGFGSVTIPPNGINFIADINGNLNYNGGLYCNGVLVNTNNPWSVGAYGNVYLTSPYGQCGIQNTNPLYPLDVNGDINFTGNLYKNGVLVNFGNNYWDINGSNVYLDPGYTNVLIGNGSLAVGYGSIEEPYWTNFTGDFNGSINYNGSLYCNGALVRFPWAVGDYGHVYLTSDYGNCGINNTNPNYNLDVGGNINFTGNLYKNGVLVNFGNNYWDINGTNIYLDSALHNLLIGNGTVAIGYGGATTPFNTSYKLDLYNNGIITGQIMEVVLLFIMETL